MPDFPAGTVTFLFTDIEGSTRLWEREPSAMRTAVDRHLVLLEQAISAHGGVRFKTVGDAVQAAFPTAADGLAAAIAAQQAMTAEPWPDPPGPLSVRMALHAGAATPVAGDYLAPSLNRLSRLLLAGHGGQVLLTETVRRLLEGALPAGVTLADLGEHRLRDLLEPERVWQVNAPGLRGEFPPLGTLAARPHNLPVPPTPLIGREAELDAVLRLFHDGTRLVTLTGPGGTGKTRLALEAAAELLEDLPDGVWLLDLAALTDPGLLLPQIAAAFGLRESGEQPLAARLAAHLAGKRTLLVLDNLEQFRPYAALGKAIADLLAAVPEPAVLATSRSPLRVRLERELPLAPLPVPSAKESAVETLATSPAVELFVARAQAARPEFTLGPHNAAAIAALCRRLDGLPLALELAAARARVLTPADILIRLGDRLDLLADAGADRPDRQRTLEGTIAWSYGLLSPDEQAAFRRLAVFAGGFTLESAEAVLGAIAVPAIDPLDAVMALVDQGLVRDEEQPDGALRFRLLETVRVFGLERLRECGEVDAARRAHAAHYCSLVTGASRDTDPGAREASWLNRVQREHDNLRAALDWMLAANSPDGLSLAVALWRFWWARGYWAEARMWLERALAQAGNAPIPDRAEALRDLGLLLDNTDDRARGQELIEESLRLFQASGDRRGEWQTLLDLSLLWASRDYGEAGRYAERALAVARELGDPHLIARSLNRLGNWRLNRDEPRAGIAHHREALQILERLGDEQGIAETLDLLGMASGMGADPKAAMGWYTRAIDAYRALGDQHGLAASLIGPMMGTHNYHAITLPAALSAGELRHLGEQSLALSREIGWRAGESYALWAYRGMALGSSGDYAVALPDARRGLDIAQEIDHTQWVAGGHYVLGELYGDLGDYRAARVELETALALARRIESPYWIRSSAGKLASVLIRAGTLTEAAATLDAHLTDDTPLDTLAGRLLWNAAADLALARGEAEQALAIADRLVAAVPATATRATPQLELLRAKALTALGRFADAERALDAAHEAAAWSGARPLLWRIGTARARLAEARGQPEAAAQAFAEAQAVINELAASVPDDALRTTLLALALHEAAPQAMPPPVDAAPQPE